MKRTSIAITLCAAIFVTFAPFAATSARASDAPLSVSLKVERPDASNSKSKTDGKKTRRARTEIETKRTNYDYEGKVGCTPHGDETVAITVEAYFITREIGAKGAKDEISGRIEIGKYEFRKDLPATQKFSFSSPTIVQTTETTKTFQRRRRRGGGGGGTHSTKSGTRLMGVIVRALHDGKPVKVVCEPSNSKWTAAGKKQKVEL